MNNIIQLQNKEENLKLLAAQRELYGSAKIIYAWQFCFSVILPVIIAALTLVYPDMAVYGALYGILLLVIDEIAFNSSIDKKKAKAAKIQEQFDCSVLKIKKSSLKLADGILTEEILKYYHNHAKDQSRIEKLKDWYPTEIGALDNLPIASLICQRLNCWWDIKLRKRYSNLLTGTLILIPLIIIIIGIIRDIKLYEIILILSALIPFFVFLQKENSEHGDAYKRLERLHGFFEDIFSRLKSKTFDMSSLDNTIRSIQDEIYENRINSPLVFDRIYKKFRSIDEQEMKRVTHELVKEMKGI
ncbi:MAG: hypothetical protein IPN39_12690 [Chitinophagaceae bacterium]|nr:hypothetical protein [Chitinophagaceae bacterium]